ncbi:MAG: hypothetical protein EOO11_02230 [Chitinophagaceae bacterium]|nr:MAG: hypothetical protein EOO11_02230 [Chitinophagaceae bacterium]
MEPLLVRNTVSFEAPAARVWDALVNPDQTRKYMFGCATVSDWKPGSPLLWEMMHEGQPYVPVKGTVLAFEPCTHLQYTVIDPNAAYPDIPENHLVVTFDLRETSSGHTVLTVTQGGFERAADGARRYRDVYNNGEGWNPILAQIKAIVEEASEPQNKEQGTAECRTAETH